LTVKDISLTVILIVSRLTVNLFLRLTVDPQCFWSFDGYKLGELPVDGTQLFCEAGALAQGHASVNAESSDGRFCLWVVSASRSPFIDRLVPHKFAKNRSARGGGSGQLVVVNACGSLFGGKILVTAHLTVITAYVNMAVAVPCSSRLCFYSHEKDNMDLKITC